MSALLAKCMSIRNASEFNSAVGREWGSWFVHLLRHTAIRFCSARLPQQMWSNMQMGG